LAIEKGLLDQLLAGHDPDQVFAKDGLLDDLKKALSERILNAELDEHIEGERADGNANRRNGHSKKSVLTGISKMTLSIPRDRAVTDAVLEEVAESFGALRECRAARTRHPVRS
jgi:putative transposase